MFVSYLKTVLIFLVCTLISGLSIAQSSQEAASDTQSEYEPESGWGNYFTEQVRAGNITNIRVAVALGGDINAYDRNGDTALHTVIKNNDAYDNTYELFADLLDLGADPHQPTLTEHNTPLMLAVSLSQRERELTLLLDTSDEDRPLLIFLNNSRLRKIRNIKERIVRRLLRLSLQEEVDIDSTNSLDQTALEIAVRNDSFFLVDMLLNAGADATRRINRRIESGGITNVETITITDMIREKIDLL